MMQPQPFFPNAKGSASGRLGEARLQTAPVSSAAMALSLVPPLLLRPISLPFRPCPLTEWDTGHLSARVSG